MTIRTRLALGILAIAVILLVPLMLSLRSLERVDNDVARLEVEGFERLVAISRVTRAIDDLAHRTGGIGAGSAPASSVDQAPAVDTIALLGLADLLEARGFDSAAFYYRTAARQSAAGADASAAIASATKWVNAAERDIAADAEAVVADASRETIRARRLAAWSYAVAAFIALAIGTWLTLSIGRPVAALKRGMLEVAEGNFTTSIPIDRGRRDEFGVLADSFATMAARLAHLERMKAVWTGVVTHELKTPINVILGNLQLGEAGILGDMTPKQRAAYATMRRNADALKGRVQRLLDVSQFEAGAGKLDAREVNLAELLDGIEASFDVIGQERGIEFVRVRGETLPSRVRWDDGRISEVLDNLLSNAFKFTKPGGRVELRTESDPGAVVFTVRDTGAGISAAQLPNLFRKFYQADNQQHASAKGTGLGLAIAKEIVEAHGGTIACESTPGVGTTFTVRLPDGLTSPLPLELTTATAS